MHRRSVLGSGALIATGFVAGCGIFDTVEQASVSPTRVELTNATGESQSFALQVEYDGDTIHRAEHEVGVGDGDHGEERAIVEIDAPVEPGVVEIDVEVAGQTRTAAFAGDRAIERFDGERVTVEFTLVRRGEQETPTLTHAARLTEAT